MKSFIVVFFIWSLIASNITWAQTPRADSIERARVERFEDSLERIQSAQFISKYFHNTLQKSNYILFSVGNQQYLIIVEREQLYDEYYFNEDTSQNFKNYQAKTFKVPKPDSTLTKTFSENQYPKGIITIYSDFFKDKQPFFAGLSSYFYLSKSGEIFGEEHLTLIVNPSPMGKDVYKYILTELVRLADNSTN